MEYDGMRHFADTWGLAFLVVLFLGIVFWVYRRGARKHYDKQADIPFKRD